MLPKDLREVSRLDFQHYLLRQVIAGNHLAPLYQPQTILDVACGTGRWMAEIAQEFPQASVFGVDQTPISLVESTIPFSSNCHFQQSNILEGLPFPPNSFDFVHLRFLIFALPLETWPGVVQDLVRVTRPGRWIELVDPDLTFNNQGPMTARVLHWIAEASMLRGIDMTIGKKLGPFLQGAGLINVKTQRFAIPLGEWGGRVGSMLATDFYEAAKTLKPLVTAGAKVTPDEYDRSLEIWLRENNEYRTSCDFYVAYGQHP
jgi:ubiquinone/menaquinone biosynthesis C-methylase UbiE